jgi:hypothetical protein
LCILVHGSSWCNLQYSHLALRLKSQFFWIFFICSIVLKYWTLDKVEEWEYSILQQMKEVGHSSIVLLVKPIIEYQAPKILENAKKTKWETNWHFILSLKWTRCFLQIGMDRLYRATTSDAQKLLLDLESHGIQISWLVEEVNWLFRNRTC